MKLPELLVPAGNLEKLKMAVHYGADAVYLSGKKYGLRSYAGNFTLSEMEEGIKLAHTRRVKVYVTVNLVARNDDFVELPDYLNSLSRLKVDGLIVSDPGIISQARQHVPHLPLHLSTQLSTSNWCSAEFWQRQGIARINLARELSLEEIALIKKRVPVKIEMFVHGALCISHSGRCLLSTYLAHRDPNRGECAHPCRWKYFLMEESRPEQYFPVTEDECGSYVFNSRDLCLIEYLPEIIAAGVDAIKIEGRMKGIHYVAGVTRVYRYALDCYGRGPDNYRFKSEWLEELRKVSNRGYTTGFLLGAPSEESFSYDTSQYIRTHELVGVVKEILSSTDEVTSTNSARLVKLQIRNKITKGDRIEFFNKDLKSYHATVDEMMNERGEVLPLAHPGQEIVIRTNLPVGANDLLRREKAFN